MRISFLFFLLTCLTLPAMAQDYQADYKAIKAEEERGKYRTAREMAENIYDRAGAAGDQDDMLKALILMAGYSYQLEEDGDQAKLELFREELAEQSGRPVVTPLLHYLLGTTYLNYASRNSWRLNQNTPVVDEGIPSDTLPLDKWNLQQLQRAGNEHLYRALELAAANRTPLQRLPAIVTIDEARLPERPTLYDVLAADILPLLTNNRNSVGDERPADPDELLAPVSDFLDIDLSTRLDTDKATYRKLKLYQEWLAYHTEGSNRPGPALAAADLDRLEYVATLGATDSLYDAALALAAETYATLPLSDRFILARAELRRSGADLGLALPRVRALEILDRIGDRDPLAQLGARNLRNAITAPELTVTFRDAYPTGNPALFSVSYKNVERIYLRLYPYDYAAEENGRRGESDEDRLSRLLATQPLREIGFTPRANDDYENHLTEYYLEQLSEGGYRAVLSTGPDFNLKTDRFAETSFQVSDLTLAQYEDEKDYRGLVTDRISGRAVPDVTVVVEAYARRQNGRVYETVATLKTDTDGTFVFPGNERNNSFRVRLRSGNKDRLVVSTYANRNGQSDEKPREYTNILTDRSIYRPGQTVRVYGLELRKQDNNSLPTIVTGKEMTVTLLDANRQEVTRQEVTTDRYGRFHLDFRLPASGLTGMFQITTGQGNQGIRVEEYKRPRFFIDMDAAEAVLPGETATVTGTVSAFAGPAMAGAAVKYRVFLEEVRYYYSFRYGGGGNGERELLESGETTTGDDGTFEVTFPTSANLAARGWRGYRYVVEVDVIDETGETHTDSANVGVRGQKPSVSLQVDDLVNRGDTLTVSAAATGKDTFTVMVSIVPVTKPDAAIRDRNWPVPDRPVLDRANFRRLFPDLAYAPTPELGDWPRQSGTSTNAEIRVSDGTGKLELPAELPVGHYRIEFNNPDGSAGEPVTFAVFDGESGELPSGLAHHLYQSKKGNAPGEEVAFTLLTARELPLVIHAWSSRLWREVGRESVGTRRVYTRTLAEDDRPGVALQLLFVRGNAVFTESKQIDLGWENKKLQLTYGTFRDKLLPGQPERWTVTVSNADGSPVAAAALATMYDKSLDEIASGSDWGVSGFPGFYGGRNLGSGTLFGTNYGYLRQYFDEEYSPIKVPSLPSLDLGLGYGGGGIMYSAASVRRRNAAAPMMETEEMSMDAGGVAEAKVQNYSSPAPPPPPPAPGEAVEAPTEEPVQIRKNLQETAFWLPGLTADPSGNLVISFDSPEALTTWKFRLFAHDEQVNYVIDTKQIKTQKDLMVLPNAPRFLREGDRMDITTKLSNLTDQPMTAEVTVELFDPETNEVPGWVAEQMGADAGAVFSKMSGVTVPAQGSETVVFTLDVPDGASTAGPLGYRVVARSPGFSDGEENVLPILTDRTLITKSMPFYVRRGQQKTINVPGLAQRAGQQRSTTEVPVAFTFQATTNPAWLALKALPYLIEYPYDCTEQLANRFFANQLAYATIRDKPVLEEVFRQWQADSNALKSELERNEGLKNALLTETPWVREARDEAQQRARIAQLFDLKKLAGEQTAALDKLAFRQGPDGAYSWFPGGTDNRYVTQYVLETFARMRQLKVLDAAQDQRIATISQQAGNYLHRKYAEDYDRMKQRKDWKPGEYVPTAAQIHYLYATSGLLNSNEASEFFLERAFATWTDQGLYLQAMIAIMGPMRYRDQESQAIITSLRERALHSDEFGMYWKYGRGYRWQELPIETHCRILEAFQINGGTDAETDDMRLWLLSNKRTNRWETTKSTAAAVFALLNTGTNWTAAAGEPIAVTFPAASSEMPAARVLAQMNGAEAATGSFSARFTGDEIDGGLGRVEVNNPANELVWGGVFYQYTEVASKVEASADGPLALKRALFRRVPTDDGIRLEPIGAGETLQPGDRVTVRLELSTDRDLDFVHLKDRRAATFEPVEATSSYDYKNGLGYYFAPGDLATNFFIDHLPKGTYTLEYDLFATYKGSFSSGLGRVQCMYAPEFGGNSEGGRVTVE